MSIARTRASLAAAAMVAAALGATTAGPATAHEVKEFPAAGCQTISDAAGDAHVNNTAQVPNDPDLDITGLTLRLSEGELIGYIKVSDLKAGPATTDGHRFTLDFTFNGHVFSASGSHYKNGTGVIRDTLAETGQAGGTTALGVDVPSLTAVPPATDKGFKESGLHVTFDETRDYVILQLPVADIAKYGGKAFTGTITNVDARSTVDNYAVGTIADTTNASNSQTTDPKVAWTVGDNKCFTVATRLALSVKKFVSSRTVTAKLTTATGQAVAGKPVVFSLNGRKYATVKTAADGTAVLKNVKPGTTVKAQFAAVSGYLGSTAQTKV
jgi:hypothetical protein